MTHKLRPSPPEQPAEQLAFLVEAVRSLVDDVAAIRQRLDEMEDDEALFDPAESLRISWQQAQRGETIPLDQLWDGVNFEYRTA